MNIFKKIFFSEKPVCVANPLNYVPGYSPLHDILFEETVKIEDPVTPVCQFLVRTVQFEICLADSRY